MGLVIVELLMWRKPRKVTPGILPDSYHFIRGDVAKDWENKPQTGEGPYFICEELITGKEIKNKKGSDERKFKK